MIRTTIKDFDTERFDFASLVRQALAVEDLSALHTMGDGYRRFDRAHDQSTPFHARFYAWLKDAPVFESLYLEFLREVAVPMVDDHVVYQRIPNLRVHLPGNVAVGEFHRDRDYDHGSGEINLWMPLTRAWDSNTVWIESEPDKADFSSVPMDYGQLLVFDGANLRHGNHDNQTGVTRVSLDFRVLPMSAYAPREERTVNQEMRFTIGEYFEVLSPESLPSWDQPASSR